MTVCPAVLPRRALASALPLEMIYSDEKRDWIEFASDRFSHLCPHIQVKIRAMRDVEAAVARVIKEGKVRTYDMGGNASTLDVAKEVAKYCGG